MEVEIGLDWLVGESSSHLCHLRLSGVANSNCGDPGNTRNLCTDGYQVRHVMSVTILHDFTPLRTNVRLQTLVKLYIYIHNSCNVSPLRSPGKKCKHTLDKHIYNLPLSSPLSGKHACFF
jgi:hypothetical protein